MEEMEEVAVTRTTIAIATAARVGRKPLSSRRATPPAAAITSNMRRRKGVANEC
jgi:hypothetical protein